MKISFIHDIILAGGAVRVPTTAFCAPTLRQGVIPYLGVDAQKAGI